MITPIDRLLGTPGQPVECKVVVQGQIEVHWFPTPQPGVRCFCGKRIQEDPSDEEPS